MERFVLVVAVVGLLPAVDDLLVHGAAGADVAPAVLVRMAMAAGFVWAAFRWPAVGATAAAFAAAVWSRPWWHLALAFLCVQAVALALIAVL